MKTLNFITCIFVILLFSSCKLEKEEFTDSIVTNEVPLRAEIIDLQSTHTPTFRVSNLYAGELVTILANSDANCITGSIVAQKFTSGKQLELTTHFSPFTSKTTSYYVRAISTDGRYRCSSIIPNRGNLLNGVIDIGTGDRHVCFLLENGQVWCQGGNNHGQLGDGTTTDSKTPVQVIGIDNAISLAIGTFYSCAVLTDHTAKCWGNNNYGQLGDGTTTDQHTPVVVMQDSSTVLANVLQLSAGYHHPCAIVGTAESNKVKCWGENNQGQLGDGSTTDSLYPVTVSGISDAKQVVSNRGYRGDNSCALLNSGKLFCWGRNDYGQIGDGTTDERHSPVEITLGEEVLSVDLGGSYNYFHSCALLISGKLKCWGDNSKGQLGDGTTTSSNSPVLVTDISSAIGITTGYQLSCAILSSGDVRCWGDNRYGQLGNGTNRQSLHPQTVLEIKAMKIQATYYHAFAITQENFLMGWGDNFYNKLGVPDVVNYQEVFQDEKPTIKKLVSSNMNQGFLATDGTFWTWGFNAYGQLGSGSYADSSLPLKVASSDNIVDATIGSKHSCFITSTGKAKCFGDNSEGQLGDGTNTSSPIPVVVNGIDNAISIASGGYANHTCVLLADSSVKCWGDNSSGQLGDGTTNSSTTPVTVSGLSGVDSIFVGTQFSCALLKDSSVKCWGDNSKGQLGDGTTNQSKVPVTVNGLDGSVEVVMLASGARHACALLASGSIKCWGYNYYGYLGDGSRDNSSTPVDVAGVTTAKKIYSKTYHSCALLSDGSAKCWGLNNYQKLGVGSTDLYKSEPTTIFNGVTGITDISLSYYNSCMVKKNKLYCWGSRTNGINADGIPTTNRPIYMSW